MVNFDDFFCTGRFARLNNGPKDRFFCLGSGCFNRSSRGQPLSVTCMIGQSSQYHTLLLHSLLILLFARLRDADDNDPSAEASEV